jgi:hypothetical protein
MTIVSERARGQHRDFLWLSVLWIVATGYNLFKPYHIDDTVYLEIAKWISEHPLHPMSGMLNWGGVDEPFYVQNQPHLYFYLMAIWGSIFGYSEPAMHALQSLAALASIMLFYRLACALVSPIALWLTAMLALGPAFIVEQNLMVDVPLLAAWLAFFYSLVCLGRSHHQTLRYVSAALACSVALLIKYSSLVLFLILLCSLLFERRRAQLWCLLIPVATIAAWSIFNYFDYGGVHIATRSLSGSFNGPVKSLAIWIINLGAITPFGLIAIVENRPELKKFGPLVYALTAILFAALVFSVAIGWVHDNQSDRLLQLCFATNGLVMLLWTAWTLIRSSHHRLFQIDIAREGAPSLYLGLWLAGASAFYILFSPFIAARHLLLIVPAVMLLLGVYWGSTLTSASKVFGLAFTIVVSTGLCLADWRFAAFYKSEAAALATLLPKTGTLWTSGHWGWQWYAAQNGIRQIDVRSSILRPGDTVIIAREIDRQTLPAPPAPVHLALTDTEPARFADVLCTRRASFYGSGQYGPWSLSRSCRDHIDVYWVGN